MKIEIEVKVEVSPDWIEMVTIFGDLFKQDYCGYWARGFRRGPNGWLVYDTGASDNYPTQAEQEAAITIWEGGTDGDLPKGFYRFDKALAVEAFRAGCKRNGVGWYENGDADAYDAAIQTALFGKLVYG